MTKEDVKKFTDNLKRQVQENPLLALSIGAMVVTATAKIIDASTQKSYARTHEKEVNRRIAKQYNR